MGQHKVLVLKYTIHSVKLKTAIAKQIHCCNLAHDIKLNMLRFLFRSYELYIK